MTHATLLLLSALLSPAADAKPKDLGCDLYSSAKAADGDDFKRLALLVGVGDYAADHITDLKGPPKDAAEVYHLLTDPKVGYGFPTQNVCVLTDEDATYARLQEAWAALVDATDKGDTVLFFYAGHGSQTDDRSGDEPDGMDETFVLHDARTPGVFDLVDDDFNGMVKRLHDQGPQQIVLALDSCNSGSAARSDNDGTVSRMFAPEYPEDYGVAASEAMRGEIPLATLPGLVVLSGATDGTPALERGGRGFFTESLTESLGSVSAEPMTWAQVGRQVEPLLQSRSKRQRPAVQGALDSYVFNNTSRSRPLSAEIKAVNNANSIELTGTALPGWGVGATARVYPGGATAADVTDPAKAKALLHLTTYSQLTATAALSDGKARDLQVGDLVVLVERSPSSFQLPTRVDRSVPAATRAAFESALRERADVSEVVTLSDDSSSFALEQNSSGQLQLRGPEGVVRAVFDGAVSERPLNAVDNLGLHARQRALLSLVGEGGADFVNNESLQVWIAPHKDQLFSCASDTWTQACPGELQHLPLCARWELHVRNTSEKTLLVGGALLGNDGNMIALPEEGRELRLDPGQQGTLYNYELVSLPPVDAIDSVVVAGTSEKNRINWQAMASTGGTRAVGNSKPSTETWTTTHMRSSNTANPSLVQPTRVWQGASGAQVGASGQCVHAPGRDTSGAAIAASDLYLEPYLASSDGAALSKVLTSAHEMAIAASATAVPFKSHRWKEGSESENLAIGVDSARAIWLAFSRAGVPYPDYITAAAMADPEGAMTEEFEACEPSATAVGDVLVYTGADKKGEAAYAALVLDPDNQVAWGAHGFSSKGIDAVLPGLLGVDYAWLDASRDWSAVGVSDVSLAACWRHRSFTGQGAGASRSLPMCWERSDECCAVPENCEGW